MPNKCCIRNCRIELYDPECINISFHKVPSDESNKQKWQESVNHHSGELKKNSYVCSLHFEKNCYVDTPLGIYRRLRKGSCPTIFFPSKKYLKRSKQETANTTDHQYGENNCNHNISIEYDNENTVMPFNSVINVPIDTLQVKDEKHQVSNIELHGFGGLRKKSLASIDLDSLPLTIDPKIIFEYLKNGQEEILSLQRRLKIATTKLYRFQKRMNNVKTLICKGKYNVNTTSDLR